MSRPVGPQLPPIRAGSASDEVFHSYSRGLCPTCKALVDGTRILRDGKVYLRKHCPEHGRSEALISGDAAWFLASLGYTKPGQIPRQRSTEVSAGCPADCGLCEEHEQHSCLPIVEITNACNLACPICIVDNRHNYEMNVEEITRIVDGLVAKEGRLDTINLSGGEPTVHPRLLELIDAATRPEIGRISISTNGLRLATDPELCAALAERGVYVNLQLDTTDGEALRALRGRGDHAAARRRALDNLERAGVRTTIIATVARGVNEALIGECVKLLLERDSVLSLMIQPAAYVGQGGATFPGADPMDRITIPDVIAAIAAQSGGALRKNDFLPLPCSHPSCFALTYLLQTDEGFIPFPRFLDLDRYVEVISNRGTIRPDERFEEAMACAIDDLWSSSQQMPDADAILVALRRALDAMYPPDRVLALEQRLRIGEGLVKTLFIHAFMDAHTFEVERIKRCCTHYALPDGRLMPGCAYNNLHRRHDARFTGPVGPADLVEPR